MSLPTTPHFLIRTQTLLNSYSRLLGKELIERSGDPVDESQRLFDVPFVVVAHGTQDDPILNYANRVALDLWEMNWEDFSQTPSRKTAEPVHRDERARMLAAGREQGYIDNYQGIRISSTGQRFRIERALIWNLVDEAGQPAGQAATFSEWELIEG